MQYSFLYKVSAQSLKALKRLVMTMVLTSGALYGFAQFDDCVETSLEQEHHALMAVYAATNGDDWINNTGWVDADPDTVQSVAGWYGLTMDGNGHVTSINMSQNNTEGEPVGTVGIKDCEKLQVRYNVVNNPGHKLSSLTLTATGGQSPYQYMLLGKEGKPASLDFKKREFEGLEAGTYRCIVIGKEECKKELIIELK